MSGYQDVLGRSRWNIEDALRHATRAYKLDLPAPDPAKRWQRMDCPFCGKDRAWLDRTGGVFQCPHADCGRTVRASRPGVLDEFRDVIDLAAHKISFQFTYARSESGRRLTWVEIWEARQEAELLVWGYANGRRGDPHDAGMLDDWETDVDGDPARLAGHVYTALWGDLMNYAQKKRRAAARHYAAPLPTDDDLTDALGDAPLTAEPGDLTGYPLLREQYLHAKAVPVAEMAKRHHVRYEVMRGMLAAEVDRYARDHGRTAA